jgi:2-polyprenyl-6-methoxyphenol hydroxylase-like FAD-dependent oxidoreductase
MEIVRPWGIEAQLRAAALPPDQLALTVWTTTLAGPEIRRARTGGDPTLAHPYSPTTACGCPQDQLEPVLLAYARSYEQADVRFEHECAAFEQDGTGVSATIIDQTSGEPLTVHAGYLIAADGASSTARSALGIPFPGPVLGHRVSILFEANLAPYTEGRLSLLYWISTEGLKGLLVATSNPKRWDLVVTFDPDAGESISDFKPQRCCDLVRKAVGAPDLPVEIVCARPWIMAAKIAPRFHAGQVFLAGDAAHTMPPFGGYGMNTGVQDVHNLAWKLAAVLSGWADTTLLDTYDVERHPVAQFNTEQALINAMETSKAQDDSVDARFQGIGIALGYIYDSAATIPDGSSPPPVADPVTEYVPTARPGSRAPHVWLSRNGVRLSTLDLFERSFVLLAGEDGQTWCAAAAQVANMMKVPLDAFRIGGDSDLADVDDSWARVYGVTPRGAVLVRPDGHVAWRCASDAAAPQAELQHVLSRLLGRHRD